MADTYDDPEQRIENWRGLALGVGLVAAVLTGGHYVFNAGSHEYVVKVTGKQERGGTYQSAAIETLVADSTNDDLVGDSLTFRVTSDLGNEHDATKRWTDIQVGNCYKFTAKGPAATSPNLVKYDSVLCEKYSWE